MRSKRARPDGRPGAGASPKKLETLFESYPNATLAMMAGGCGAIAVLTLIMEILSGQIHAQALSLPFHFVSAPLGVATLILGVLTFRGERKYALPALIFGGSYWLIYVVWIFG